MRRDRKIYTLLVVITLFIGLASRKYPGLFGDFLAAYLGDTLWALLVFWLFAFLLKNAATLRIAVYALSFSYVIEISQLYHAAWLNDIRATTPGALILGHGFLWTDILCYTVGIIFGAICEYFFLKNRRSS